ncbi:MAG: hypothetical protein H0T76_25670 [Nannocystis sp.]|nr:hypothetical protein [Nannocystis sp.]MBA3549883.1 hypothetical protein [Nannocystis sp.]
MVEKSIKVPATRVAMFGSAATQVPSSASRNFRQALDMQSPLATQASPSAGIVLEAVVEPVAEPSVGSVPVVAWPVVSLLQPLLHPPVVTSPVVEASDEPALAPVAASPVGDPAPWVLPPES